MEADRMAAMTAFSALNHPGQDRHKVTRAERRHAMRTMRAIGPCSDIAANHRDAARDAVNSTGRETAQGKPEDDNKRPVKKRRKFSEHYCDRARRRLRIAFSGTVFSFSG